MAANTAIEDRVIQLGPGLSAIPERLLLAHARGEVLFICGAGISQPAGLPGFRQLVVNVYATLDTSTHSVLTGLPPGACNQWLANCAGLGAVLVGSQSDRSHPLVNEARILPRAHMARVIDPAREGIILDRAATPFEPSQ